MYYFYQDELSVWGKVLKNAFLLVYVHLPKLTKNWGWIREIRQKSVTVRKDKTVRI